MHARAFPGFPLTDLGSRFLMRLYNGFATMESGLLLVAESPGRGILGLLAGSPAPGAFFRALLIRRGMIMALIAIPGLTRHPARLAKRLLAAIIYRGDRPPSLPGYWLLSSLAVDPSRSRSGVGASLVRHFCKLAADQGSPGVYLLSDADHNEAVLRFYEKLHFVVHSRKERRDGRRLLLLTRTFSSRQI